MTGDRLTVTRMAVEADGTDFTERTQARFKRQGAGLVPLDGSEIDGDAGQL